MEFEDIKQELVSDNIMIYPDWNEKFILATDASKQGLGAVLSQIRDRKERLIAYASRGCTASEQNYGVSQLEGLGVIWAIDKFRPYFSHQKFTLVTNHRALTKLREVKDNNPMLYQWSLKLAGYDYKVEYKKGEKHGNADRLSQNLVLNITEKDIEETEDLTLKRLCELTKDNSLPKQFMYTIEESETDIVDPDETPLQRFWRLQNTNLWCKNLIRKVYIKGNLLLDTSKGIKGFEVKGRELRKNDHKSWVIKERTFYGINFTGKVKL
jgi:hypothetical protein